MGLQWVSVSTNVTDMTTTYTTATADAATIYCMAFHKDGVYHYRIVADCHDTGRIVETEGRDMDAILAAAGITLAEDFHNGDPRFVGACWKIAEGAVTR